MPNKKKNNQAKNAFYFFMVSLRPQLERQGVILENGMQSVAEIAGPRWKVGFVFNEWRFFIMSNVLKTPYFIGCYKFIQYLKLSTVH